MRNDQGYSQAPLQGSVVRFHTRSDARSPAKFRCKMNTWFEVWCIILNCTINSSSRHGCYVPSPRWLSNLHNADRISRQAGRCLSKPRCHSQTPQCKSPFQTGRIQRGNTHTLCGVGVFRSGKLRSSLRAPTFLVPLCREGSWQNIPFPSLTI